jgi:anti-sigma factor RsiW
MDHAFIDNYAVADRYVKRTLPPAERATFEAHLVDCQECADRVLLAEMLRNGVIKPIPVETPARPVQPRLVREPNITSARLWKLALFFAAAAAALLAVPTAVFLWQLHRLR